MDYRLDTIFSYHHFQHCITIGGIGCNNLSNDEIIQYTSDALTHEHIHHVLSKLFGITTCKLFDAIESNFRDEKLVTRVFEYDDNMRTWSECIKTDGFIYFLMQYHIDTDDIKEANIKCNTR
jgi:hypothetical protein